jgi:hypothetical protein
MFVADIESLDVESTCVILSVAIVDFDENSTFESLLENTLFVKFDAKEQISKYKRTVSKSTLDWWAKQSDYAKDMSLKPSKDDLPVIEGINKLRMYLEKDPNPKKIIWTRGTLDSMALESLCRAADIPALIRYNENQDVRTAINLLSPVAFNGYCEVDYPGFDKSKVKKHCPINDVCYDAMMLLHPKQ